MTLRYTMFQAMVDGVGYGAGGLKTVWERALTQRGIEVYACVPGSLKQRCVYGSGYQIGSLHVRTTQPRTVSILLFANGKVKCSGSYRDLDGEPIAAFVAETVRPVWRALEIDDTRLDETKIDVRLLNAGFALHNMNERLYFALCNEIRRHYTTVVMPPTMITDDPEDGTAAQTRPRGRFCAMKIYVNDVRPGPSLHFDHKGKVQAFAFRSVESIHAHAKQLCAVVDRIRESCVSCIGRDG